MGAIEVRNLHKTFGKQVVLDDVSLVVQPGTIMGLVGNNGSGKSVLMKCICGLVIPDHGEITVLGQKIGSKVDFLQRLGALIEKPGFLPNRSGFTNLRNLWEIRRCVPPERIEEAIVRVGLDPKDKKVVGKYSLGMRQRLAIAVALIGEPELMLLDEPINGLDPEGIKEVRELLLRLNREKDITILISSHILTELSLFATNYGFIRDGEIVREVTAEDIFEASADRCYIETDDNEKALSRLTAMGYNARPKDGGIRIASDIDLMRVCADFSENGVYLTRHIHDSVNLEEYFMRILEGGK